MLKRSLFMSLSVLFAFALLVSCGQNAESEAQDTQAVAANLQKISLDVDGMTCSGCEYNVESALNKIAGVTAAQADHEGKSAEITFDADVADVQQFIEAVNGIGYSAKTSRLN